MYKLVLNNSVIGPYETVIFTKKSKNGSFVACDRSEADGIVAGGKVYAITNSVDYKDYDQVAVFELDGEVARSAELDYMRIMTGLV